MANVEQMIPAVGGRKIILTFKFSVGETSVSWCFNKGSREHDGRNMISFLLGKNNKHDHDGRNMISFLLGKYNKHETRKKLALIQTLLLTVVSTYRF